jgi:hypothetical protein
MTDCTKHYGANIVEADDKVLLMNGSVAFAVNPKGDAEEKVLCCVCWQKPNCSLSGCKEK